MVGISAGKTDINRSVSDLYPDPEDALSLSKNDFDSAEQILSEGEIEILGRMPYSSNATFLVDVTLENDMVKGIYKPLKGERPLWDFPPGLYKREIATYELSEQLGWSVVPPTIEREGPHGIGSVQLFVDADFSQHHFTLVEDPKYHADLRKLCALDFLANNTDRKAGHCLLSKWGRIYGIDHGLCFSTEFKLRTVIWDFAGERIDNDLIKAIEGAGTQLSGTVTKWLAPDEQLAVLHRAEILLNSGLFPEDDGYRWPWPLI